MQPTTVALIAVVAVRVLARPAANLYIWNKMRKREPELYYAHGKHGWQVVNLHAMPWNWRVVFGPKRYFDWVVAEDKKEFGS